MQYAGGILLPPVRKLVATTICARWRRCKRVSPLGPNPPVFSTKTGGFDTISEGNLHALTVGAFHFNQLPVRMPAPIPVDRPHHRQCLLPGDLNAVLPQNPRQKHCRYRIPDQSAGKPNANTLASGGIHNNPHSAYSTKILTTSPSEDSTSTKFPTAPWLISSIICFQSIPCSAAFPLI